ncbi:MAG TPA: hypothetical protein VHZ02_05735 [Acidimicrobiales bacterium]|nr:hypothetical protein [Acidimicrobiales bacterium]
MVPVRVDTVGPHGRSILPAIPLVRGGGPPATEDMRRHRTGVRSMEFMGGIVPALCALPQPVITAAGDETGITPSAGERRTAQDETER